MHLRKRNSYCLSAAVLWFSFAAIQCNAFTTAPATAFVASHRNPMLNSSSTSLKAAAAGGGGFGGSAGSKDKATSSSSTLKPKQQWDRYLAMGKPKDGETVTTVNVAVRREENGAWLAVGAVRSASDVNVAAAVARQRSLIADHARRLHPLQISKQDKLEWGYSPQQPDASSTDEASWSVVDTKTVAMESGLEKKIGFQGQEDPASGYYCLYNGGRRVTGDSGAAEGKGPKPQSKKRDRDVN